MNAKVNARGKINILPSPHWPGEVLECPLIWVIMYHSKEHINFMPRWHS
jgi:hypothetical protein